MPGSKSPDDAAEELGRKAARLVKAVTPRVKRAIADAKPQVEKAGRQIAQYARDHDAEIKDSAAKVVRARVRGPFGFLFDAVSRQYGSEAVNSLKCPSCEGVNPPEAKFCNHCGFSLAASRSDR